MMVYYILDGQHKFSAAMKYREVTEKDRKPIPDWCTNFRCLMVDPRLPLDKLQTIAGRQQAKQAVVQGLTFSQTVDWYFRELQAVETKAKEMGSELNVNHAEILKKVYEKTGKNPKMDGTMVCSLWMQQESMGWE